MHPDEFFHSFTDHDSHQQLLLTSAIQVTTQLLCFFSKQFCVKIGESLGLL